MARRRKQKKQPKPQIKLRSFDATEESRALLQRCAEQGLTLPDFFVDSICGAYGNDAAKDIVFGIVKAKTRPTTFRVNTLRATKSVRPHSARCALHGIGHARRRLRPHL